MIGEKQDFAKSAINNIDEIDKAVGILKDNKILSYAYLNMSELVFKAEGNALERPDQFLLGAHTALTYIEELVENISKISKGKDGSRKQ